jgi:hypothetical protein
MRDDTPDYSSYTLAELQDVLQRIDREKFPDRYRLALQELHRKEAQLEIDQDKLERHRPRRGGCLGGCVGSMIGSVVGGGIPLSWMLLFPAPPVPNMDGMNRYGGQMGMILLGLLIGPTVGACVGASRKVSGSPPDGE